MLCRVIHVACLVFLLRQVVLRSVSDTVLGLGSVSVVASCFKDCFCCGLGFGKCLCCDRLSWLTCVCLGFEGRVSVCVIMYCR